MIRVLFVSILVLSVCVDSYAQRRRLLLRRRRGRAVCTNCQPSGNNVARSTSNGVEAARTPPTTDPNIEVLRPRAPKPAARVQSTSENRNPDLPRYEQSISAAGGYELSNRTSFFDVWAVVLNMPRNELTDSYIDQRLAAGPNTKSTPANAQQVSIGQWVDGLGFRDNFNQLASVIEWDEGAMWLVPHQPGSTRLQWFLEPTVEMGDKLFVKPIVEEPTPEPPPVVEPPPVDDSITKKLIEGEVAKKQIEEIEKILNPKVPK